MNTRIIFVDDEANVLSGLRRMLRGQRKVWDMHFANGGAEALDAMSKDSFDVIVSDMRMPGIDGAELLDRVSKLYPNTVRLVLSGQSEHEKIFRAIGPAHQFMSKPCDPDVLIKSIQRACGLHSQLQDVSLKNLTSQISCLPSLPSIYRELVEELESDDASMDRVGDMIGSDLAMTAKILQLVNSSFFGLPQHVTCTKHAVALLGLNIIRPLLLTAKAFSQYEDPQVKGFSLEQSIQHSLAVAVTAKQIAEAEASPTQVIDDAFMAGMLHDIGKLILAVNKPASFEEAVKLARGEQSPLWKAELKIFGTTHAEVGAHLLGLWGLPDPIVEAVAFHHQPSNACIDGFTPLAAVHVANALQHPHSLCDETPAGPECDAAFIETLNAKDRLPVWSSLVTPEAVA